MIGTFNVLSKFAARIFDAEQVGEERGVIINTASVAAFEGQIGQAAYSASRAALSAWRCRLRGEFARYGIRVNTIAPGLFLTPLLQSLPQEAPFAGGSQVPFPSRRQARRGRAHGRKHRDQSDAQRRRSALLARNPHGAALKTVNRSRD